MIVAQINQLPADKKQAFDMQYMSVKKQGQTTMILALFGLSQLYLGEIGAFIVYLFTCGGVFIWAIMLLVNAKKRTIAHNDKKALEILAMVK